MQTQFIDQIAEELSLNTTQVSATAALIADGGTVFLEVRTDNEPAIGLYESVGFVKMGVRKRYYRISGADAYSMRRDAGVSSESGGADVRSNQVT